MNERGLARINFLEKRKIFINPVRFDNLLGICILDGSVAPFVMPPFSELTTEVEDYDENNSLLRQKDGVTFNSYILNSSLVEIVINPGVNWEPFTASIKPGRAINILVVFTQGGTKVRAFPFDPNPSLAPGPTPTPPASICVIRAIPQVIDANTALVEWTDIRWQYEADLDFNTERILVPSIQGQSWIITVSWDGTLDNQNREFQTLIEWEIPSNGLGPLVIARNSTYVGSTNASNSLTTFINIPPQPPFDPYHYITIRINRIGGVGTLTLTQVRCVVARVN
jgi:hypothetical protein